MPPLMENLHLFEVPWILLIQTKLAALGGLFKLLTYLGAEIFYLITPLLLLGVDRRKGVAFCTLLIIANVTTNTLKLALHWPRPYWVDDRIIGMTPLATSYGMPSGHAYLSMALWGWLALEFRKRWTVAAALTLTEIIGLSRVVLGVHWISDVLVGWVLGLITLLSFRWGWPRIEETLRRFGSGTAVVISILLAAGVLGLNEGVRRTWAQDPDPTSWPVKTQAARAIDPRSAGMALGFGIGLVLARRHRVTALPDSFQERAVWVALGAAGVGLLLPGMNWVLRKLSPELVYETELVRAILCGLWLAWGVAWLRRNRATSTAPARA